MRLQRTDLRSAARLLSVLCVLLAPVVAAQEPNHSPETAPSSLARHIEARLSLAVRPAASEKKSADAIMAFYRQRQFAPVFVAQEGWLPKAQLLIKRLAAARYDGLNAGDYDDKAVSAVSALSPDEVKAAGELALARFLLRYARHAMGGRVDVTKLQPNVFVKRPEPDVANLLNILAQSANPVAVIEAQNPPHAPFLALRRELGRLLDENGARNQASIDDIIVNMERWRWLPRQLGSSFVMVSLPEYMVRFSDGGRVSYQGRVIIGQPTTPTPLFSGEMQYIVVNPTWTVPPGILKNEILPLYRRDPAAIARRGLQIVRSSGGGVSFRQAPGERNALGRVKFMFPNDHAIYLHDTPGRHLFTRHDRALSHGCVRVDQPLKFADAVFAREDGLNSKRIEGLYGKSERHINLKRRIPVHLTYFTLSEVDGRLSRFADVYGLDYKMKQVMGLHSAGAQASATLVR